MFSARDRHGTRRWCFQPTAPQHHRLPSARPRCGAALGLALPPSPWWLLAQLPFLEGVLLTPFPQTRAYSLDSAKSNTAMLKEKEQQLPSLHKMHGHPMAISKNGTASEDYTRYFTHYDMHLSFPTRSSCILDFIHIYLLKLCFSYNSSSVVQASSFLGPVVHFAKAETIRWYTITLLQAS